MAAITDQDLFTGVINIDTSPVGVSAEIDSYSETIEAEWLEKLLGETLYTDYLVNPTTEKWVNLIDGIATTFEYNGKTMKYTGLADKFCFVIYYRYMMDQPASNTAFGDVAASPSNGTQVINLGRNIRAYNKWVDAYNKAIDFINYSNGVNQATYDGFVGSKLEYINSFGI